MSPEADVVSCVIKFRNFDLKKTEIFVYGLDLTGSSCHRLAIFWFRELL